MKRIKITANRTKRAVNKGIKKASDLIKGGKKIANKKVEEAFKVLDQNGDGKINLMDFVVMALKTPGIKIKREEYLKNSLQNRYPKEVVYEAIQFNPKHANVENSDIESIADESIEFERKCATSGSAVLGIPGGLAVTATLPIDIVQYFAFLLRAAQKLMYIYGYGDLNIKEDKKLDEGTMQVLELCLGVMLGVQGADTAFRTAMHIWAQGVKASFKEGGVFLKHGIKALGAKFGGFVFSGIAKLIPLFGGLVSGGVTYVMFKPSCNKLKKLLRENPLNSGKKKKIESTKKVNKKKK